MDRGQGEKSCCFSMVPWFDIYISLYIYIYLQYIKYNIYYTIHDVYLHEYCSNFPYIPITTCCGFKWPEAYACHEGLPICFGALRQVLAALVRAGDVLGIVGIESETS